MKWLFVLPALLMSQVSVARPTPGAPVRHILKCQIVDHLVGVHFDVEVVTQALSPEHNVRSMTLLTTPVVPHPVIHREPMNQMLQDETTATFTDGPHVVVFDKAKFYAKLYANEELEAICNK